MKRIPSIIIKKYRGTFKISSVKGRVLEIKREHKTEKTIFKFERTVAAGKITIRIVAKGSILRIATTTPNAPVSKWILFTRATIPPLLEPTFDSILHSLETETQDSQSAKTLTQAAAEAVKSFLREKGIQL